MAAYQFFVSLRTSPQAGVAIRKYKVRCVRMNYYVYILSNATNVAIYVGITKDLVRRVYEHKHHCDPDSFTARYDIHKLVYYECTSDVKAAIEREKQIKGWNRKRKNKLVETMNPQWQDLYDSILY